LKLDTKELKGLVQKISDLPTLPSIMIKLNRLMEDPKTSAEDLGRAISTDPVLSSKVLKLVNSPFYGFPGRIGTMSQAVVILGFSTIRNLVLTTSVMQALSRGKTHKRFDTQKYWLHSLATGALARVLAKEQNLPYQEEAFIGGLLHDIGKMIICQNLHAEFEEIETYEKQNKCSTREAELAVLGLTHQEIGGWLAQKWHLPMALVNAIHFHHQPLEARLAEPPLEPEMLLRLVDFVHVADNLAHTLHASENLSIISPIEPQVGAEMQLNPERIEALKVKGRVEEEGAKIFLQVL
jgi:putative nucleotidyltransferase with HDIG domain